MNVICYECDYTEFHQRSTAAKSFKSFMFVMFIAACLCLIVFYTCVARKAYMSRKVRPTNYVLHVLPLQARQKTQSTMHTSPKSSATNIFCTFPLEANTIENGRFGFKIPEQSGSNRRDNQLITAKKVLPDKLKAAKILSLVTLVFILSWLPFWIIRLSSMNTSKDRLSRSFYENKLTNFFNHLFYFNNAANPLIYAILHKPFRKECLQMLKRN